MKKLLFAFLLIPTIAFAQQRVFNAGQPPLLNYFKAQQAAKATQVQQSANTHYLNELAAAQRLQNYETGQRLFNPSYNGSGNAAPAPQYDAAVAIMQAQIQQQLLELNSR